MALTKLHFFGMGFAGLCSGNTSCCLLRYTETAKEPFTFSPLPYVMAVKRLRARVTEMKDKK